MALWLPWRKQEAASEVRDQNLTMQDYFDAVLAAQQNGFLQTTMPSLKEEQVVGNYRAIANNNGPIWALMLVRMQLFSQARFQWTRFSGGEPGDLFGDPGLSILEKPWANGTTADLLARMEVDVTTAGNAYVRRLSRGRLHGTADRLVRLNPDYVTVILGSQELEEYPADAADVELVGYMYMPRRDPGRAIFLRPDEVAHYAPYPDPSSVFIGMSWVSSVIRDVLGDNLQTDHKRAFLKNAATPQVVIRFDPSVTIDKVKVFKELFEEEHEGVRNAYKTLFLGGGADATVVGKDFKELDFAATQGKGEARLASAAGVPPSWVGFSEGLQGSALNAGNFTAASRRLSDGTMQHLWMNVAASLEAIVDQPKGGNANLWFATRGIPFLHADSSDEAEIQSQEAATITNLVREGFTPESAVSAVSNHDWSLLKHTGLTSVQLLPPSDGKEPFDGKPGTLPPQPDAGGSGNDNGSGSNGDNSNNGSDNS